MKNEIKTFLSAGHNNGKKKQVEGQEMSIKEILFMEDQKVVVKEHILR